MKKWIISIIIILILIFVGLYICVFKIKPQNILKPSPRTSPTISEPTKQFTFEDKIALASFYGWYYKDPAWAETTDAEHPLAGSYYPTDDDVIDYQLTLATDVGLDAFLYSWNGTKNPSNEALIKMINKIETTDKLSNFKIALLYENINFNFEGPNKPFIDELSYLIKLSKDHPALMTINDLPIIFVYNAQGIPVSRWDEILSKVKTSVGEAYLIAMPDNWEVTDDYFKYFQTITTYADKYFDLGSISDRYEILNDKDKPLIATLIGGSSHVKNKGYDFDRVNGKYLFERYEVAKKNNADWLYVTSWNEWFEFNTIEPSREYKFETAKYLREILENFKDKTFSEATANWTVSSGSQTQIKNDGPGNIYYVRCGMQDRSLLLSYVIKAGEVGTFNQSCPEVSGWLLNNTKLEYKK